MNGTKKIGFKTSGAPNKIGSFTPKNVGTTEARPIARFRFDLHNHINMNGTIKSCTSTTHSDDEHLCTRCKDLISVHALLEGGSS